MASNTGSANDLAAFQLDESWDLACDVEFEPGLFEAIAALGNQNQAQVAQPAQGVAASAPVAQNQQTFQPTTNLGLLPISDDELFGICNENDLHDLGVAAPAQGVEMAAPAAQGEAEVTTQPITAQELFNFNVDDTLAQFGNGDDLAMLGISNQAPAAQSEGDLTTQPTTTSELFNFDFSVDDFLAQYGNGDDLAMLGISNQAPVAQSEEQTQVAEASSAVKEATPTTQNEQTTQPTTGQEVFEIDENEDLTLLDDADDLIILDPVEPAPAAQSENEQPAKSATTTTATAQELFDFNIDETLAQFGNENDPFILDTTETAPAAQIEQTAQPAAESNLFGADDELLAILNVDDSAAKDADKRVNSMMKTDGTHYQGCIKSYDDCKELEAAYLRRQDKSAAFLNGTTCDDFPFTSEEQRVCVEKLYGAMRNLGGIIDSPRYVPKKGLDGKILKVNGKQTTERVLEPAVVAQRVQKLRGIEVEFLAWKLLWATRDAQLGKLGVGSWTNDISYQKYKCWRDRFNCVVTACKESKAIVMDLIDPQWIMRVARNPAAEYNKKVSNRQTNAKRHDESMRGRRAAEDREVIEVLPPVHNPALEAAAAFAAQQKKASNPQVQTKRGGGSMPGPSAVDAQEAIRMLPTIHNAPIHNPSTHNSPARGVSVQGVPVQGVPGSVYNSPTPNARVYNSPHTHPVQNPPVYNTPVQSAPVHNVPGYNTPVQHSVVHNTPILGIPVQNYPVQNQQVSSHPVQNSFIQGVPIQNHTIQGHTIQNPSIQGTPIQNHAIYNSPNPNAHVYNSGVRNSPVHHSPVRNSPSHNPPIYNAPAQNPTLMAAAARLMSTKRRRESDPSEGEGQHKRQKMMSTPTGSALPSPTPSPPSAKGAKNHALGQAQALQDLRAHIRERGQKSYEQLRAQAALPKSV